MLRLERDIQKKNLRYEGDELLKFLRSQGCEFIREAAVIHGGGIEIKINDHQFRDIPKYMIISREKFVKASS